MHVVEDIICGTSTTGTGTLTLAAVTGQGGVDLFTAFSGMGLGTTQAVPVPYTLLVYTDNTFTTLAAFESGWGALTLGSSLTTCTLARAPMVTSASLTDYNFNAPSALNITTAANVLIEIGPSSHSTMVNPPYFNTADGDKVGIAPMGTGSQTGAMTITTNTEYFVPAIFCAPILARRATTRVPLAYTGGTSNVYARIYAKGTNGRPGKLLADFGVLGSANASLNSAGNIASSTSSPAYTNPPLLRPGCYIISIFAAFSGGSGSPQLRGSSTLALDGTFGMSSGAQVLLATATSPNATAPDPANTTGFALSAGTVAPIIWLNNA